MPQYCCIQNSMVNFDLHPHIFIPSDIFKYDRQRKVLTREFFDDMFESKQRGGCAVATELNGIIRVYLYIRLGIRRHSFSYHTLP